MIVEFSSEICAQAIHHYLDPLRLEIDGTNILYQILYDPFRNDPSLQLSVNHFLLLLR